MLKVTPWENCKRLPLLQCALFEAIPWRWWLPASIPSNLVASSLKPKDTPLDWEVPAYITQALFVGVRKSLQFTWNNCLVIAKSTACTLGLGISKSGTSFGGF